MVNERKTIEEKKLILMRPQSLRNEIMHLRLIVEEYRKLAEEESCISNYSDKWLTQAQEAEEHLNKKESELEHCNSVIVNAIDNVREYDLRLVLFYHYIDNYSWAQIEKKMFASRSTILRLHRKALDKLQL